MAPCYLGNEFNLIFLGVSWKNPEITFQFHVYVSFTYLTYYYCSKDKKWYNYKILIRYYVTEYCKLHMWTSCANKCIGFLAFSIFPSSSCHVIFDWDSCILYITYDKRFCNARQELIAVTIKWTHEIALYDTEGVKLGTFPLVQFFSRSWFFLKLCETIPP